MTTRHAGIDPGVSGAIAILRATTLVAVHDMPLITDRSGRRRPSAAGLAELLRQADLDQVIIEHVSAAPVAGRRQGTQSMFSFGRGLGVIEGVTQALGIPLALVTPAAWKARAGLLRHPKDYARTVALQLYPQAPLHRKRDIGRADAILIARYGRSP